MKILVVIVLLALLAVGNTRRRRMGGRPSSFSKQATKSVGKGIATLIKHIADGAPDDADILDEDPVEDPSKRFSAESEEMSFTSMLLIALGTIIGVAGILFCSFSKARQTEESTNWARIRERNQDRQRNYATLQAIAEHGVHPDRANGNIYRIRL